MTVKDNQERKEGRRKLRVAKGMWNFIRKQAIISSERAALHADHLHAVKAVVAKRSPQSSYS